MLCKKCGAQIPDDAAKCEFCGEVFREEPEVNSAEAESMGDTQVVNLPNTAAEETTENSGEQTSYAEDLRQRSTHDIFEENARKRKSQTEKVVDEKQQQLEEITMRRSQKRMKQKRNRIILICCVCALVAAAAGFGTYYIRNGGLNSPVIATPMPSTSPIPTLAPVQTSAVHTPNPAESAAPNSNENTNNERSESNSSSSDRTGNSGSGSASRGTSGGSSSNGSGSGNTGSGNSSSGSGTSGGSSSSGGNTSSGGTTASGSNSHGTTTAVNTGKYTGIVTERINSKLVVGNEVVYDAPSDKYFMTFNMDGVMYYAHVSKGSTTEQVKGKYITLSAEPTNGRYAGNTVYEITSMTYYEGDYIIPDSGVRAIEKSEIQNLSKDQLGLARNEIYARHGRKFQMSVYQKYFEGKSWYKVNPNYDYTDDNNNLNDIELKNVETILSVENTK